jgi:hypothetical protein
MILKGEDEALPHHYISLEQSEVTTKVLHRSYSESDDTTVRWIAISVKNVDAALKLALPPGLVSSQDSNMVLIKQGFSTSADHARVAHEDGIVRRKFTGAVREISVDLLDLPFLQHPQYGEMRFFIDATFDRRWPLAIAAVAALFGGWSAWVLWWIIVKRSDPVMDALMVYGRYG